MEISSVLNLVHPSLCLLLTMNVRPTVLNTQKKILLTSYMETFVAV